MVSPTIPAAPRSAREQRARARRARYLSVLAHGLLFAACGDAASPSTVHDASTGLDASTPTSAQACFEDLAAPAIGFVELQRFAAASEGIVVWRARKPGERSAVGETFPFDLERAWIESPLEEPGVCVTSPSALTYAFGHHNWNEEWTVQTAHARYVVRESLSFGGEEPIWNDTLEARDEGDDVVLGPVALSAQGCESKPYDLNPCFRRTRSDQPPAGWGEE